MVRWSLNSCGAGRVRPSTSPYGAPVTVCSEKGRLPQDVRGLPWSEQGHDQNKYPLPRIDDLLDTLGNSKVFSTLDLKSGYHQDQAGQESDIPKTAFNTPFGHFE
jgi:hypothetical protein